LIGRNNLSYFTLLNAEMETSKNGSSKLVVMTVLEPKDELDEVTCLRNLIVYARYTVKLNAVVHFKGVDLEQVIVLGL